LDARHDEPRPAVGRLSIRIDCVTRSERVAPHYRVRAIGGMGRDGKPWRLSEEAAIAAIENDRASFFVERPKGYRRDIIVAQGLGKAYLRGASDGDLPETLLALPDCDAPG